MYLKRAEELLPADLVAPHAPDVHADIVCRVLAVQDPPEEPEQPPPEGSAPPSRFNFHQRQRVESSWLRLLKHISSRAQIHPTEGEREREREREREERERERTRCKVQAPNPAAQLL